MAVLRWVGYVGTALLFGGAVFVDDDPRTAVSKVVLLARDDKIQDSSILAPTALRAAESCRQRGGGNTPGVDMV